MQRNKYIISVCVSVLFLLVIVGCNNSKNSESNINNLGFKSYNLSSFEDLDTVLGDTQYEERIFVFGGMGNEIIYEYSSIDGVTRNKIEVSSCIETNNKIVHFRFVDLDENGGLIVGYEIIGRDGSIESCNVWKEENGESVELNSTNISKMICYKCCDWQSS